MEKEVTKLYLNDMTRQKMYKIFGLRRVNKLQALEDWLISLPDLTEEEITVAKVYQRRLLENIDDWNEQELSLGFIGPIINLIPFKIPYRLNFFAQRSLSTTIDTCLLYTSPSPRDKRQSRMPSSA